MKHRRDNRFIFFGVFENLTTYKRSSWTILFCNILLQFMLGFTSDVSFNTSFVDRKTVTPLLTEYVFFPLDIFQGFPLNDVIVEVLSNSLLGFPFWENVSLKHDEIRLKETGTWKDWSRLKVTWKSDNKSEGSVM